MGAQRAGGILYPVWGGIAAIVAGNRATRQIRELVFETLLPSPLGRVAERSEVGRGSLTYCFLALFRKMAPENLFRQPFGLPPSPKGKARRRPCRTLYIMYNANAIPGGGDGGWCYVFPKRYMARALSASGLLRVRRIPLMSKRMTPQWPRKVGKQMTLR